MHVSLNLLRSYEAAGVDLTNPGAINAAAKLMNETIDEMEGLIGENPPRNTRPGAIFHMRAPLKTSNFTDCHSRMKFPPEADQPLAEAGIQSGVVYVCVCGLDPSPNDLVGDYTSRG